MITKMITKMNKRELVKYMEGCFADAKSARKVTKRIKQEQKQAYKGKK